MGFLIGLLSNARQGDILSISLVIFSLYFVSVAAYRLFLHPLRSVPGPWYAAISSFWITTHILRLRRCRAIDELVQKYGPVVRVAPNEVIFVDVPTLKVVYGVSSKLAKTAFYKSLQTAANDHAMSTLEHSFHAVKKRGYAPHYIPTNLALFQPEIHSVMLKLVDILTEVSKQSSPVTDTLVLFRHLLIDLNCAHLFLHDTGMMQALSNHLLHNEPAHPLSDAISDFPKRGLLKSALPAWMWNLLTSIPSARWQKFCDSDAFIGQFVGDRVREARTELMNGKVCDGDDRVALITRLLQHKYSENVPMPEKDIISECQGHMVAGTDTTSTTLSYILWELSRRRDLMLRLQQEIDSKMPDPRQIPDIRELQELSYLTATIKEGLRVYTAAPSPLPRVVPNDDYLVLGHKLPKGTVIASQAWSSHRRSDIFFSPDLFLPERWIMEDPSVITVPSTSPLFGSVTPLSSPALSESEKGGATKIGAQLDPLSAHSQMSAHMFPFGHGPRVCGGQNMAQIVLRIALATIVRNFDVVAAPETNEHSMEMKDSFVIFPSALECKLIFVPRAH